MGNCLVTKLKENVNNGSIPRVGEIELPLLPLTQKQEIFFAPAKCMEIVGAGHFENSNGDNLGQVLTNQSGGIFINGTQSGDMLKVSEIYSMTSIILPSYKIIPNNTSLVMDYFCAATYIDLSNYNRIAADFNNFNNTVVEYLRMPDCPAVGSVEGIVEKAISLGRTSGNMTMSNEGGTLLFKNMTYDATGFNYIFIVYSSGSATIYQGENNQGAVLATYSGGSWTYNF